MNDLSGQAYLTAHITPEVISSQVGGGKSQMKIKAQSICVNIILADREAKVGSYPSRANTDATTFLVLTESNTS